MADQFWARFIRNYLPTLQPRQKCNATTEDLAEGAIVLLIDPQLPRASWPIGKITTVHRSADSHVRSVDVRVKDRVYTRPATRLIRLPALPDSDSAGGQPSPTGDQAAESFS